MSRTAGRRRVQAKVRAGYAGGTWRPRPGERGSRDAANATTRRGRAGIARHPRGAAHAAWVCRPAGACASPGRHVEAALGGHRHHTARPDFSTARGAACTFGVHASSQGKAGEKDTGRGWPRRSAIPCPSRGTRHCCCAGDHRIAAGRPAQAATTPGWRRFPALVPGARRSAARRSEDTEWTHVASWRPGTFPRTARRAGGGHRRGACGGIHRRRSGPASRRQRSHRPVFQPPSRSA